MKQTFNLFIYSMAEYYLKNFYFNNFISLPICIIDEILQYLPDYKFKDDIRNKRYLNNGIWYKRLICINIVDISRDEINYFDWYKIFHNKDYHMLVKYENRKVKELLESKSIEEINKIHMHNLNNCHQRNHMSFRF